MFNRHRLSCAALSAGLIAAAPAIAQETGTLGYPGVYNTNQLLDLQFTIDAGDLATIQNDETFDIEVPTWMSSDGDPAILVSIRRKSASPIGNKISYKVDINEYVGDQVWNKLKKMSLENGDDQDVVSEGLAWYIHRAATGGAYTPGLASYVNITINGENRGVYLHVEQVDKSFLKNRAIWDGDAAWHFKQDDIGLPEYKEGPTEVSPTMELLNWGPFALEASTNTGGKGGGKGKGPNNLVVSAAEIPNDWQQVLRDNINMDAMLTLGACNAFADNPDALFNKGKNFFWTDYDGVSPGNTNGKRVYHPWDLDAAIRSTTASIYGQTKGRNKFEQHPFQELILNDPGFREQYNLIMLNLLNNGLSVASLQAWLDETEATISTALAADPNNQIGGNVAGHFNSLRQWVAERHANVYQQVIDDLGYVPSLSQIEASISETN